jgi:L-seryl-tRNA(Ser) seleniumtransferase
MQERYRSLPSVDRLVEEAAANVHTGATRALLTTLAREIIAQARSDLAVSPEQPDLRQLAGKVIDAAYSLTQPSLRPLINATGVILHTNLGRAPLSDEARSAIEQATRGYTNLEFDLRTGDRGSRHDHLDQLVRRVTGAEAGMAVNNNAGALVLALTALAAGGEVVISRSQAVEIGGGFRIPDVMRQSGVRLVEVGTTNRTYVTDFEAAACAETRAFLRVHASNFRIRGFTSFPDLPALAGAAHAHGCLLLDDLGSGCLLPVERYGLSHEPTVQESLAAGADLALFSGDKLLGGPQAGILVGRRDLIRRLRSHPLARALRLDKASLAGLAATLQHYLRGEAIERIPVWRMIAASESEMRRRVELWQTCVPGAAEIVPSKSVVGGGSLPDESLPTWVLAIRTPAPAELAARLRDGSPPLVARIEQDRVLVDPRTVDPRDDTVVVQALGIALASEERARWPQ